MVPRRGRRGNPERRVLPGFCVTLPPLELRDTPPFRADRVGSLLTAVYTGVPAANAAFAVSQRVLEEDRTGSG
jgi:hypothetical protein